MGKVHGSLARAGKVRGQTPKVAKQDKKNKDEKKAAGGHNIKGSDVALGDIQPFYAFKKGDLEVNPNVTRGLDDTSRSPLWKILESKGELKAAGRRNSVQLARGAHIGAAKAAGRLAAKAAAREVRLEADALDARRVLVVGGENNDEGSLNSTEVLNLDTMASTPGPELSSKRSGCAAVARESRCPPGDGAER